MSSWRAPSIIFTDIIIFYTHYTSESWKLYKILLGNFKVFSRRPFYEGLLALSVSHLASPDVVCSTVNLLDFSYYRDSKARNYHLLSNSSSILFDLLLWAMIFYRHGLISLNWILICNLICSIDTFFRTVTAWLLRFKPFSIFQRMLLVQLNFIMKFHD